MIGTLFSLPKWLLCSKYKGTLLQRLGLQMPPAPKAPLVIWFHMVSLGETRAMIPIFKKLKKQYPEADYYFSSTTKTGHQEAKRSLPQGSGYFFLPVDLLWIMRRLVGLLRPNLLILSESDFWLNMLKEVKKQKGKILLLNGKISKKSYRRFSIIQSKNLFNQINHFLVQNATYAARFQSLGVPKTQITITGNLKLATEFQRLNDQQKTTLRSNFGINANDPIITIASTHEGEENLILSKIPKFYKILLAARHPERFQKLKDRYFFDPRVIVIDQMGILLSCYQISEFSIIGGSFFPGIGGHNIFEPVKVGIPVIFGPFMDNQPDLVRTVLKGKAGIQTQVETLELAIKEVLSLKKNAQVLSKDGNNILKKTFKALDLNYLLA